MRKNIRIAAVLVLVFSAHVANAMVVYGMPPQPSEHPSQSATEPEVTPYGAPAAEKAVPTEQATTTPVEEKSEQNHWWSAIINAIMYVYEKIF